MWWGDGYYYDKLLTWDESCTSKVMLKMWLYCWMGSLDSNIYWPGGMHASRKRLILLICSFSNSEIAVLILKCYNRSVWSVIEAFHIRKNVYWRCWNSWWAINPLSIRFCKLVKSMKGDENLSRNTTYRIFIVSLISICL